MSDEWVLAEVGWGEKGDFRNKASANSELQKSVVGGGIASPLGGQIPRLWCLYERDRDREERGRGRREGGQ